MAHNEDDFRRLTVGEMREALSGLSDDHEIDFGSTVAAVRLEFYRFKSRGDKLLQIELSERFPIEGTYSVTVERDGPYTIDVPHIK